MKKSYLNILYLLSLIVVLFTTRSFFEKDVYLLLQDETYNKRAEGIQVACYLKNLDLPIYISPNRFFGEDLSKKKKPIFKQNTQCPMCLDKELTNTLKLTKNFTITPNKYPYFKNHFIVLANTHIKQDDFMNTSILEESLNIHKNLSNFSLYFNQYAGNTIEHLHFHLIDEVLPIENEIVKLKKLKFEQNWKPYQHMPSALLYYGNNSKMLAKKISTRLNQITQKGLAYNLQCFHHNNHQAIVVWIRKSEPEFIRILPDNWLLTLSAFDLSGAFVIKNTSFYNSQKNTITISAWDKITIHKSFLEKQLKNAYKNNIVDSPFLFPDIPTL